MGYSKKKKPSEEMESDPVGELIVGKTNNIIRVSEIPEFQNNCICTDPENTKLIKAFEKTARNSLEYKNYFYYLKHNMDFTQCAYLPFVRTGIGDIHIELHHALFTLFDITKIVVCKHIEEFGFADEFTVAEEVMRLHYENLVALIPVSPTVHELIHSQSIDVHPNIVYGYWKEFINQYRKYFTDDIEMKVKELEKWEGVPTDRIPQILQVKYTFLQYAGLPMYQKLAIEDHSSVVDEINSGLNEID